MEKIYFQDNHILFFNPCDMHVLCLVLVLGISNLDTKVKAPQFKKVMGGNGFPFAIFRFEKVFSLFIIFQILNEVSVSFLIYSWFPLALELEINVHFVRLWKFFVVLVGWFSISIYLGGVGFK